MYPVSTAYRARVLDTSRVWDLQIRIILANGVSLNLTKENLKLGTFSYKDGSVCSDAVHTGATFSSSVEFTIANDTHQYSDYEFYGAKVYPSVGLALSNSGSFEYVPLGEFNVIEPVKRLSTIPLVCFDNMALLNRSFDFSTMTFPTSVGAVYSQVLSQCGITAVESLTTEVNALTYEINSFLTNGATCRDVLAGIGVMLLKNLRFNRQGRLESYWYSSTTAYTNADTRVGNSSYGDEAHTITGVFVEDAYGNVFSHGTSSYPVELPTSPMLQGSDMVFPILENTLSKLQQSVYRAATVTWIGDPAVQAGDIVEHRNTPVGTVQLAVMRVSYKFAGTSTFESLGPDVSTLEQPTATDRKMRKAFEQTRHNYEELKTSISQTAEQVKLQAELISATGEDIQSVREYAAQLAIGAEKIETSVRDIEGVIEGVSDDLQNTKGSITSLEQTASDFKLEIQKINEDGVTKVSTTTGIFDESGLTIDNTESPTKTTITPDGMKVYRKRGLGNEPVLSATSNGVDATNLHAKTYLIIGDRSRFENYGSDRTGCFWIGDAT